MMLFKQSRLILFIVVMSVLMIGTGIAAAQSSDTTVLVPQTLERLSWGAVIAGTVLALIIQLALNLLGVSVGISTINPESGDSAEPKTLASGAAVWLGVSTLIALFFGGWVAARLSGVPNNTDGILHGLLTWAVVMLITVLFMLTALGRFISGLSSLMSEGLSLAARTAQGVASGVAGAAQGVASGVAGAAQTVAGTAQNVAQGVAQVTQDGAENVADAAKKAANEMDVPDVSYDKIMNEVRLMIERVGVKPEKVQATAEGAVQEVKTAASDVVKDPSQAEQIIGRALDRILRSGQQVVSDVDRESVVNTISAETGMNPEQARMTLARWERMYQNEMPKAREQVTQTVNEAQHKVEEIRGQVEQKVADVRSQAEEKVAEIRQDVEDTAREAAQAVTEAIARLAAVIFAAIVIGAIAAGLGGALGTVQNSTAVVQVDVNSAGG